MKKIEHIKIGTDNNAFDWILESERNGTWAENNSDMIRKLVKRHNDMADLVNKLLIHIVSNTEGKCCDNPTLELGAIPEHKFCGKCGADWK